MKNKNTQSVFEPNTIPYLFFLVVFAVATFLTGLGQKLNLYLAAAEGVAILALVIYSLLNRRKRRKALKAYIESVTYSAETAKNSSICSQISAPHRAEIIAVKEPPINHRDTKVLVAASRMAKMTKAASQIHSIGGIASTSFCLLV